VFAVVIVLLSWLYLSVRLLLYATEINVVLAKRLWPRRLLQPPLTDPDRRVLAALAETEQRRPEDHGGGSGSAAASSGAAGSRRISTSSRPSDWMRSSRP
jgi:hypothetical protein